MSGATLMVIDGMKERGGAKIPSGCILMLYHDDVAMGRHREEGQVEDRLTHYAERIHDAYPGVVVATIRLIDQGQNNDVVVVNEGLIFRFPRYVGGIAHLQREVGILRAIRDRVPLPIPNPAYTSFAPPTVGYVFMGYRVMGGAPLGREALAPLNSAEAQALIAPLAHFLRCLHGVPPEEALPGVREPIHPLARWEDLYARICQRLFPHMRPDARAWAVEHFEAFLRDPRNRRITPALVHGDFGGSNILYDAHRHALTGVIDFGSAGLDDPAVDFAAVSTLGPDTLTHLSSAYPEVQGALARVAFYRGTFALQEALFGIENDDAEAFRAGIEEYA